MRNLIFTCLLSIGFISVTFSQTATITGIIKDGNTGEPLESATVLQPPANGTVTDIGGNFSLKVSPGEVTLIIRYIGLNADTVHVNVKQGQNKVKNIALGGAPAELQTVVVTENKIGVKIQKVTESVEVMKASTLEDNNITNMIDAVTKMPGVSMFDQQMSVRGGSGFAYGAGSRVMLVVDDMPLMTADRSDIKWAFIPIENAEQVELVKGASSMQYGASAMDGVLNVTTAYARDTPTTKIGISYQGYGKPPVDSFKWWNRNGKFFQNPNKVSMDFLHSEKIGDFEFVFSGMMLGDQSYLQSDYSYYSRFSGKVRWHPRKLNRLTIELEASGLYDNEGFQFYWLDAGHPYISAPGVAISTRFFYSYMDPKIRYIDKKGNEHKIYGRIYNQSDYGGVGNFLLYSFYYQFRHDFGKYFRVLAGANETHGIINNSSFIGGTHHTDEGGAFVQGQVNYKFLTLNAGVREEFRRQDTVFQATIPLASVGANFEIRKYNYIRASFGQAYRFPSIAEEFVTYQLGSLNILPNPGLLPEHGFTTELGYKRSIKIGNWLGYFDASTFYTDFKNMIEFDFGVEENLAPYFKAENVSHARIFGWELETEGEGHLTPDVDMVLTAGYTYFYGVNVDDPANTNNQNFFSFLRNAFTHYILKTELSDQAWNNETAGMLKYRNPQQFKADVEFNMYKNYHVGSSLTYYGYLTQVDPVFLIAIAGVDEYRMQTRNKGDAIWDLRCGYDINRNIRINFLVKNVIGNYTVINVARPDPMRSYTVQLLLNFGGRKPRNYNLPEGGGAF